MGVVRPIRAEEVVRLWPAVRAAKLMNTAEEFARFREAGPWRVRVSEAGEGLVLDRWRAHQDLLDRKSVVGGNSVDLGGGRIV